ncbi:uncharacterized protein LOC104448071 [Eucalyptus grandis]|uniref:uncharacterized protein LOC104448071 n=1 Tax=Eucalyptus grandis TaxID=71139 RepID=UPI00192E9B02|nr:uncharacterized protein LOC104448071 [Eucalyptus grandis]
MLSGASTLTGNSFNFPNSTDRAWSCNYMGMRGIMNKKVENDERCGEKASPYVQMVPSKRHQRVILRMFAIFKKNPGMKLLGVEVGKSNGCSTEDEGEDRVLESEQPFQRRRRTKRRR